MGPTDLLSDSGEFTQQKVDCIIARFGFSNPVPLSRKKTADEPSRFRQ
jgi:hypothetical protein